MGMASDQIQPQVTRSSSNSFLRMNWIRFFAPIEGDLRVLPGDRYGRRSPEEDRATCAEFYSQSRFIPLWKQLITEAKPRELMHLLQSDQRRFTAQSGEAFTAWATAELRRSPQNIEPLLKLAWVEWFLVPGVELRKPFSGNLSWEYKPVTGLAQRELQGAFRELFVNSEFGKESASVANTFRSVRSDD